MNISPLTSTAGAAAATAAAADDDDDDDDDGDDYVDVHVGIEDEAKHQIGDDGFNL